MLGRGPSAGGFALWVALVGLAVGAPALGTRGGALDGTVVLLHGLGRSEYNMKILEWRLEARGHRVCNVGYETRVATIEGATDEVAASIARCGEGRSPFISSPTRSADSYSGGCCSVIPRSSPAARSCSLPRTMAARSPTGSGNSSGWSRSWGPSRLSWGPGPKTCRSACRGLSCLSA